MNAIADAGAQALPIAQVLPELSAALARGHAVLSAPPGSGKTTRVPLALLDAPWLAGQRIVLLEPRRPAARLAAAHMAGLLGERVGETLGYQVRFERRIGPRTRIEVVTEGILTRRLQQDPELAGVGLLIFDEFHERSLQADLGLALALDVVAGLRPDLRLLIMSATLDTGAAARLLGGAPVIQGEGRAWPVEIIYAERTPGPDPVEAVVDRRAPGPDPARRGCPGLPPRGRRDRACPHPPGRAGGQATPWSCPCMAACPSRTRTWPWAPAAAGAAGWSWPRTSPRPASPSKASASSWTAASPASPASPRPRGSPAW